MELPSLSVASQPPPHAGIKIPSSVALHTDLALRAQTVPCSTRSSSHGVGDLIELPGHQAVEGIDDEPLVNPGREPDPDILFSILPSRKERTGQPCSSPCDPVHVPRIPPLFLALC